MTYLSDIIDILEDILQQKIDINDTMQTVASWDSLSYIDIVTALEEKFNVYFDSEDLPSLDSVKNICDIIERKIILHKNSQ